jgi:hypothetical protein
MAAKLRSKSKKNKFSKKPKQRVVKDEDGAYWADLNNVLDLLFDTATKLKMTWADLATQSGLALGTIHNLGDRLTRRPQFRTIRNLGLAVGMKITFQNNKAKVETVAAKQKVVPLRLRRAV